jgi:hypothetical protein
MADNTTPSDVPQDRRPIPGYEGVYEIDRQGNVYTLKPSNIYKAGHMRSGTPDPAGYIRIALCRDGQTKFRLMHRLLMLVWNPIENSDDLDVNHIDGDKANNSLSNLEWVTHQENIQHARKVLKKWRDQRGSKTPGSKLTEEGVKEIRRLWADGKGMKQKDIASIYGVTQEAISVIVRRKLWQHVE